MEGKSEWLYLRYGMRLRMEEVARNLKHVYKTDEVQNAFGVWYIKGIDEYKDM